MADVLRTTTFQLEFHGENGIAGIKNFTKAVTDADAMVAALSAELGSNATVTYKAVQSTKELTAQARALANQIERTNAKVDGLTKQYEHQISIIGKTADEQEVLNAMFKLGANATTEQKDGLTALIQQYQMLDNAHKQVSDTNNKVSELTELYARQSTMIGKTAKEQEVLNAVYKLGEYHITGSGSSVIAVCV